MAKLKKVLFVIDKMTVGGAQRHLRQVIPAINYADYGYSAELYCLSRLGELGEELRDMGTPVHVLGIEKIYNIPAIKALDKMVRIIKEREIDIVHTYLFSSNVYGVWAAHRVGNVKIISSRRDTGFELGYKHILMLKWVNRWVNLIMVNSEAVKNAALELERVPEKKIMTIYNGITPAPKNIGQDNEALRNELDISEDAPVVGIVANLRPVKDHATFLQAAKIVSAKLPHARFVLVGDGPLRGELEKLASELGIKDKVIFTGSVSTPRRYIRSFDISVLTSETEGFSNAVIEAMAEGIPVIASNTGGNVSAVIDGSTGFLVSPGDYNTFAEKIIQLAENKEMRESFGAAAKNLAEDKFSFDGMISEIKHMYDRVLRMK